MTTLTCNTETEAQWQISEREGLKFIRQVLPKGWTAILQGGSNSTISDIFILDEKGQFLFAIEIKQLPSAGGMQFVVENIGGLFVSNNTNSYVPRVLGIINSTTSRAKNIFLDSVNRVLVQDCLLEHFASKNVKLVLITNASNSYFKLLPISNLFAEVSVNLNFPRPKKSGSQDFPKTMLTEAFTHVHSYFGTENLSFYTHQENPRKTMVNIPITHQSGKPKGIYLPECLYLGFRPGGKLASETGFYTYELRKISVKGHDEIKPTVIINLTKIGRKTKQTQAELDAIWNSVN